jgi:hypothetical protein
MSAFLEPLCYHHLGRRELTVLAGAIHGLASDVPFILPFQGFSILQGSQKDLVPEIWHSGTDRVPRMRQSREPELLSTISFQFQQPHRWPGPLELTLPLSSTAMTHNLPSILSASHWEGGRGAPLKRTRLAQKQSQVIKLDTKYFTNGLHAPDVMVPLIPITPPRQVMDGWENILRRVNINGAPVPASQELETVVQEILQDNSAAFLDDGQNRFDVWAMVVPPDAFSALRAELLGYEPWPKGMGRLAARSKALEHSTHFPSLLGRGCRFHKIRTCGHFRLKTSHTNLL